MPRSGPTDAAPIVFMVMPIVSIAGQGGAQETLNPISVAQRGSGV